MFSTMALELVVFVALSMAILVVWFRLKETTKMLNVYISANNLRANMYDNMADRNSNLLIYVLGNYLGNSFPPVNNGVSVDYNSLNAAISKVATKYNVPKVTAKAVLFKSASISSSFDKSVRFTKLALTLHCAVTNKPLDKSLVFNESSMTVDEVNLVKHMVAAYAKNTVSYDPAKYNQEKITLKFPAGITNKHVYDIYKDVVKGYKDSLFTYDIPHPLNLVILRKHIDVLAKVELSTADKPEFARLGPAARLVVAMITVYAVIEKEEIYPFFTGEYALAIYLRTIILNEKRKNTLSVL